MRLILPGKSRGYLQLHACTASQPNPATQSGPVLLRCANHQWTKGIIGSRNHWRDVELGRISLSLVANMGLYWVFLSPVYWIIAV